MKIRGVSDNFSIDGLCIKTDDLLAQQSVVSIIVHLPDASTSELKGSVRRVEEGQTFKYGMGIEIIERDSKYIAFFLSLLSDNRP